MSDKINIMNKIRALMAKTVDAGCTEEEALAATEAASKLMAKYQIDTIEDETNDDNVSTSYWYPNNKNISVMEKNFAVALAMFCDCKIWISKSSKGRYIGIMGFESDREFFLYLMDVFKNTHEHAYREFIANYQTNQHGRSIRQAFSLGFSNRVNEKLRIMKSKQDHKTSTGTSLVVCKEQIIKKQFEKEVGKLRNAPKGKKKSYDADAYFAGHDAGDKVQVNRGIGGQ